ncbi:hypothetical protein VTO73DRAFT_5662 [Trametes versicolor]
MQMSTPFYRDLSAPDAPVVSSASAEGHPAAGLGRPAEQAIIPSGYISQWASSVPPFYRDMSPAMGIVVLEPELSPPVPVSTFPDNVGPEVSPRLFDPLNSPAHTEAAPVPLGDSLQALSLPTDSLAQDALPIVSLSSQSRRVALNSAPLFENIITIYGLEDERGSSTEGSSPYSSSLLFAALSSTASSTPLSPIPLPSISSNFTRLPTRYTVFIQRPLLLRSELSSCGRDFSRFVQISTQPYRLPAVEGASDMECEYCGHRVRIGRYTDFRKHLASHFHPRARPGWVCLGVPIEHLAIPGHQADTVRALLEEPDNELGKTARRYHGMDMVGGCGGLFARRDALARHLHSLSRPGDDSCFGFGDANVPWLEGIVIGDRPVFVSAALTVGLTLSSPRPPRLSQSWKCYPGWTPS